MWLFTKVGFFSVVSKPGDGDRLTVRARVRGDLVGLKRWYLPQLGPITALKVADYPFRAQVDRKDFADAAHRIASDIDYPNFKDEVKARQGDRRAAVYHRIWADLLELEPPPKRRGRASRGLYPDLPDFLFNEPRWR